MKSSLVEIITCSLLVSSSLYAAGTSWVEDLWGATSYIWNLKNSWRYQLHCKSSNKKFSWRYHLHFDPRYWQYQPICSLPFRRASASPRRKQHTGPHPSIVALPSTPGNLAPLPRSSLASHAVPRWFPHHLPRHLITSITTFPSVLAVFHRLPKLHRFFDIPSHFGPRINSSRPRHSQPVPPF